MDDRGINKLTTPDNYLMPRIDELIERVGKCKGRYFTCLDLMKDYHQVKVADKSKPKTTLTLSHGTLSVSENAFWLDERSSNVPASDELTVCWEGVEFRICVS